MQSLRDIRREIKAIGATRQIMLTMKRISSARIRKAQKQMEQGRPFAQKMALMIDNMRRDIENETSPVRQLPDYKFFDASASGCKNAGLLLITADKGLCGAFNAMAIRETLKWIKRNDSVEKYIFVVGKKGRDFLARLKIPRLHIAGEIVGIFPRASYAHASMIFETIRRLTYDNKVCKVDLIYNNFKSMSSQALVSKTFLPFNFEEIPGEEDLSDFIFEPDMLQIFLTLLPRYIGANIYRFLLESQAAELAARMNAMEAAAENAGGIMAGLGVQLNKVRQETITNELTEIISGANALEA
ncbi:MAG: ATP synthase F1 subunit gamma [Elusimicrobiota bacterium]|jgi:F-type H+-transporting ATPase subunit gamma|nr:ATP synthase F1 subunit gamma [Elusimicrobiota bacterium]